MHLSDWHASFPFGDYPCFDADDLVFHYTSVDRAAAIALTGSLFLGPLAMLNDPQEAQARQIVTMTTGLDSSPSDEERGAFERQLHELRSSIRVACFTRDGAEGAPGSLLRADSRGFARSKMWAHYGAGHAGACIVFSRSLLEERARHLCPSAEFGQVAYPPGFNMSVFEAENVDFDRPDINRQHIAVVKSLFSKNADWSSEREYRIVIDDWHDPVCAIPIADAVKGLALGVNLQPHQIPLAEALRTSLGLEKSAIALMIHTTGALVAVPMYGPDDEPHRWTEDEQRSYLPIFD